MRALLSSVGTRGDVQPLVALASSLRELGQEVRLCVPPNFVPWVRDFGFEAIRVGVEMRAPAGRNAAQRLTPEQLRRLRESMPDLISDQFEVVGGAAEGCDLIVGANAHQYAARSIAELRDLPYLTALYAPVSIPSPDYAPPPAPGQAPETGETASNLRRWAEHRRTWNERALERVNHNRTRLGLAPIDDVLLYNITERPWLATDAILVPLPSTPGIEVFETGAWILNDSSPLPGELADFCAAGEPPLYVGFGSMPVAPEVGRTVIAAARAVGRRLIVSRGWAELLADDGVDCIVVGDVNQQALFPRLAAVVHHGGAGTTATAARAGVPQVVVPMFSDQFFWASRVVALGIGASVVGSPTSDALASALQSALEPATGSRARDVSARLGADGATVAARRLVAMAT